MDNTHHNAQGFPHMSNTYPPSSRHPHGLDPHTSSSMPPPTERVYGDIDTPHVPHIHPAARSYSTSVPAFAQDEYAPPPLLTGARYADPAHTHTHTQRGTTSSLHAHDRSINPYLYPSDYASHSAPDPSGGDMYQQQRYPEPPSSYPPNLDTHTSVRISAPVDTHIMSDSSSSATAATASSVPEYRPHSMRGYHQPRQQSGTFYTPQGYQQSSGYPPAPVPTLRRYSQSSLAYEASSADAASMAGGESHAHTRSHNTHTHTTNTTAGQYHTHAQSSIPMSNVPHQHQHYPSAHQQQQQHSQQHHGQQQHPRQSQHQQHQQSHLQHHHQQHQQHSSQSHHPSSSQTVYYGSSDSRGSSRQPDDGPYSLTHQSQSRHPDLQHSAQQHQAAPSYTHPHHQLFRPRSSTTGSSTSTSTVGPGPGAGGGGVSGGPVYTTTSASSTSGMAGHFAGAGPSGRPLLARESPTASEEDGEDESGGGNGNGNGNAVGGEFAGYSQQISTSATGARTGFEGELEGGAGERWPGSGSGSSAGSVSGIGASAGAGGVSAERWRGTSSERGRGMGGPGDLRGGGSGSGGGGRERSEEGSEGGRSAGAHSGLGSGTPPAGTPPTPSHSAAHAHAYAYGPPAYSQGQGVVHPPLQQHHHHHHGEKRKAGVAVEDLAGEVASARIGGTGPAPALALGAMSGLGGSSGAGSSGAGLSGMNGGSGGGGAHGHGGAGVGSGTGARANVGSSSSSAAPFDLQPVLKKKKKSKMHECEVCGKKFPRPSGLKTHMNTHNNEKPYPCGFPGCTRTFGVRSNAKRHLRTHGVLPSSVQESSGTPYVVGFSPPMVLPSPGLSLAAVGGDGDFEGLSSAEGIEGAGMGYGIGEGSGQGAMGPRMVPGPRQAAFKLRWMPPSLTSRTNAAALREVVEQGGQLPHEPNRGPKRVKPVPTAQRKGAEKGQGVAKASVGQASSSVAASGTGGGGAVEEQGEDLGMDVDAGGKQPEMEEEEEGEDADAISVSRLTVPLPPVVPTTSSSLPTSLSAPASAPIPSSTSIPVPTPASAYPSSSSMSSLSGSGTFTSISPSSSATSFSTPPLSASSTSSPYVAQGPSAMSKLAGSVGMGGSLGVSLDFGLEEERNSFAPAGSHPYHPSQFCGLPGPAVVAGSVPTTAYQLVA